MELVAGTVAALSTAYNYYQLSKIEEQLEAGVQELPAINDAGGQEASSNSPRTHCVNDLSNVLPSTASVAAASPSQCGQNRRRSVSAARAATTRVTCEGHRQLRSSTVNQRRQVAAKTIAPKLSKVTKRRATAATCPNTKACRPGKITKNAFLNFIRTVRLTLCGHHQTEVVKEAARRWRTMTCEEKRRYNRAVLVKGRKWSLSFKRSHKFSFAFFD